MSNNGFPSGFYRCVRIINEIYPGDDLQYIKLAFCEKIEFLNSTFLLAFSSLLEARANCFSGDKKRAQV
jgi:hypothetical protein